ncbi:MAG: family 20 glycosylhydrolase [Bacteroidetes bacterium]|nr:family 20 glycosylhydrolase [Bacteroidota bacterium]
MHLLVLVPVLVLAPVLALVSPLHAQQPLIPQPVRAVMQPGAFHFDASTTILIEGDSGVPAATAGYLAEMFGRVSSFTPKIAANGGVTNPRNSVLLSLRSENGVHPEGYMLRVSPGGAVLRASTEAGLFYGIQTLRQLLPPRFESAEGRDTVRGWDLPCCMIQDAPRFRWRGLLLDCCRHFMDVEFVKRTIDLIAQLKMNRLHWHLTEDQGWRIEIRKYPLLTDIGAWRTEPDGSRYGGYYTQDQIRDVVAYAAVRHVTVVPEIEMPGHSLAALAAYPKLSCTGGPFDVANSWGVFKDIYCAGNDDTFTFLAGVLTEVMQLFPSQYIHIGGDEAPKFRWEHCDLCQARMAAEGLADEEALQSWFIARIERFLNKHGRWLIGWDEILQGGLAPNATVQSWQGLEGAAAAARSGHTAIVSPTSHAYFDYPVSSIDLEKVYAFDPVPPELTAADAVYILGGECNMWTERAPQRLVESKLYPRILAMAEVLWAPTWQRTYGDFHRRVQNYYPRLDTLGVRYGFEAAPVRFDIRRDSAQNALIVALSAGQPGLRFRYFDPSDPFTERQYDGSITLYGTGTLRAFAEAADERRAGGTLRSDTLDLRYDLHAGVGAAVTLGQRFSASYSAGGADAMADGLRGTDNFRDGRWQGYEAKDVEITLDLGSERFISELSAGFLQYQPAWIFMPRSVTFSISRDGTSFTDVFTMENDESDREENAFTREFGVPVGGQSARYVRLRAKTIGTCPDWHPGAGGKAWIFIDEFVVR